MNRDGVKSGSKGKRAVFSAVPIKVSSYEDLTQTTSSSNSIRRRKTDFDVQSMTWTTTSAKDFVTTYLRLKVRHQRTRHLRTSSILGDTSPIGGSFIKSSLSVSAEEVHRRSPKEVATKYFYYFYQIFWLLKFIQLLNLFYWVLRMIRFVVRLSINLKKYIHSNNRSQIQTAAELHYYALETGFRCEKLVFCKSDFAATNRVNRFCSGKQFHSTQQVYIPKWALDIMRLQPELRCESDVKRLVSLFRLFKGFKDKFSDDAQEEFCQHCHYTWYILYVLNLLYSIQFYDKVREKEDSITCWPSRDVFLSNLLWICVCQHRREG